MSSLSTAEDPGNIGTLLVCKKKQTEKQSYSAPLSLIYDSHISVSNPTLFIDTFKCHLKLKVSCLHSINNDSDSTSY